MRNNADFGLVVSGNAEVRETGSAALAEQGINPIQAASYARGTALLRACLAALRMIVVDIQPEGCDPALLDLLRSIPRSVPVLFACDADLAPAARGNVVPKPVHPEELAVCVRLQLGTARRMFG